MGKPLRIEGNQPGQHEFLRDRKPGWSLYQGGLGSGKTWAAARKLLWLHATNRCPSLAVAPTYGDLWRFVVPELQAACQDLRWALVICPNGSGVLKYPHLMVAGQPIILMGTEHPSRFAGFEVGAVWIDEGARIKATPEDPVRDAPTQIRGRLRHRRAKVLAGIVSTTPEGTDTWVQADWFDQPKPDHRAYFGSTMGNRALPSGYVDALRGQLPAELQEQYLEGRAISFMANRAHPTFSRDRHVGEDADWIPGRPVLVGCDYNVSPMCWVACQLDRGVLRVVDEVVIPDCATVDAAVLAADSRLWQQAGQADGKPVLVDFHPDAASAARRTTGDSELAVTTQTAHRLGWRWTSSGSSSNPPVAARISHLSRLLLDGMGRVSLRIHPRCRTLIEDLERTGRAKSGAYDPGSAGKRGHILDALGYVAWRAVPPLGRSGAINPL